MATGTVKWFNNAKGYGFVRPDEGGDDLFVHYSYIQEEGYKTLYAGQDVEYELREASKGYHAVNLKPGEVKSAKDGKDGESPTSRRQKPGRRDRENSAVSG